MSEPTERPDLELEPLDLSWPALPPDMIVDERLCNIVESYLRTVQKRWEAATKRRVAALEAKLTAQHREELAAADAAAASIQRSELEQLVAAAEMRLTAQFERQLVAARVYSSKRAAPAAGTGTPQHDLVAHLTTALPHLNMGLLSSDTSRPAGVADDDARHLHRLLRRSNPAA